MYVSIEKRGIIKVRINTIITTHLVVISFNRLPTLVSFYKTISFSFGVFFFTNGYVLMLLFSISYLF